ncbi:MAG: hypothetical protein KDK30_04515 [Leptospiraceae bacterium]|nr:hypothetical protein [Leptospiraceae bacterium]MCB1314562.1 hypothetical protein [Leptospiraceae bacterium]
MQETEATAEVFITAFNAMPRAARDYFLTYLARDRELMEDLMDIALIEERRDEPSRPLSEILGE